MIVVNIVEKVKITLTLTQLPQSNEVKQHRLTIDWQLRYWFFIGRLGT
jgi:hypothetical protein